MVGSSSGLVDAILGELSRIKQLDADATRGRLFTYIYETGIPELRRLAHRAFDLFLDTNALDPTTFRSALVFEREVVSFAKRLAHAGEDVVGTATYGGTESIFLAVKAARWLYRRRAGASAVGEVVAPVTVHPSTRKAAHYLGLRVVEAPVDPESKKALPEAVKEALSDRTALVVLSAPNFPYGTIDPIRDIAEAASDRGIPVHVDACVGGFILPFLEELGERVEPWDFRVEGVTSVSLDAHKYGYTPKGVSIILFRGGELKKGTIYVDLKWPGYSFINTIVLSSRSAAPLAAAWAVFRYLGWEGYRGLAERVISARDYIVGGLRRLGFREVAPVETPLVALTTGEEELFKFHVLMTMRGWVIGLQPRVEGLAPYNIHLTIAPIHDRVKEEFIRDAEEAVKSEAPRELEEALRLVREDPMKAAGLIGESPASAVLIARLLDSMPRELAEEVARELVVELFK